MNINLVFEFLKAFLGAFYDKGLGSIILECVGIPIIIKDV